MSLKQPSSKPLYISVKQFVSHQHISVKQLFSHQLGGYPVHATRPGLNGRDHTIILDVPEKFSSVVRFTAYNLRNYLVQHAKLTDELVSFICVFAPGSGLGHTLGRAQ